jgi:hypothetical protein
MVKSATPHIVRSGLPTPVCVDRINSYFRPRKAKLRLDIPNRTRLGAQSGCRAAAIPGDPRLRQPEIAESSLQDHA